MITSLRQPVLPESSRAEAARRLGIDLDALERVLQGQLAFRDGRSWEYSEFCDAFPQGDFHESSTVAVCPVDLLLHEIEVPRDVRQRLVPPIAPEEVTAARIVTLQRFLEVLETHHAPSVIIANTRRQIQAAYDAPHSPAWSPMRELMTGKPAAAGAQGEPTHDYSDFDEDVPGAIPVDAAFLGSELLVQFPFASIVLNADAAIVDAFPTCGMRAVARDERRVLFVQGGGGASMTGYFGANGFVRDLETRQWLHGELPKTLSPYLAGTIGDMKWSVVVDVSQGAGYRISPFTTSDMCGHTFNSACGDYVWDGGDFVLEAATGKPTLDVRELEGDLLCFAKAGDTWRFVLRDKLEEDWDEEDDVELAAIRMFDELGQCLNIFDNDVLAVSLSGDGNRLLQLRADELEILDVPRWSAARETFDLQPLKPALEPPDDSELWRRLAVAYGIPAAIGSPDLLSRAAVADPKQVRARIHCDWIDDPTSEAIQFAIDAGAQRPGLPTALPRK